MDPRSELEIFLQKKYDRFTETHEAFRLYGPDFQRIMNELKHGREKLAELRLAGKQFLEAAEKSRNVLYVNGDAAVDPSRHSLKAEGTVLNARIAEFRIELEKP